MIQEQLTEYVLQSLRECVEKGLLPDGDVPEFTVEIAKKKGYGDFSSNVAMVSAKAFRMPPQKIAEVLVGEMKNASNDMAAEITIAGPGFVNFFLSPRAYSLVLRAILDAGSQFGRAPRNNVKMQVEFVSANPVGPLHVGGGRWAAFGDTLCNMLDYAGYTVEREFYINDAGAQMHNFALSIDARLLELSGQKADLPEDGYHGEYIVDLARSVLEQEGPSFAGLPVEKRLEYYEDRCYRTILGQLKEVLERAGVVFDVWFSERDLHKNGEILETLKILEERGMVYEKDGARWISTSRFGDEKDRVVVKSNGDATYFLVDLAYHRNKFERGFKTVIDLWGFDHIGHITRMKAAMQALGYPDDFLEMLIGQLVNLYRGNEVVRMSKRAGQIVAFDEVLDEVGKDAVRFLFLLRNLSSTLDFDIELAKEKNENNPVYYVQYAHARICSIRKMAEKTGVEFPTKPDDTLDLLVQDEERDLIRKIDSFPAFVISAAQKREPHHLTFFAVDVARTFHSFYNKFRVIGEDPAITKARLMLMESVRLLIGISLDLLGVNAPEKM